jgi:hypothetical protein
MNKHFVTILCLALINIAVLSGCERTTPTSFSEPTATFAIGWPATKTPILTATSTQMATLTATPAPTSASSCADAPAIRLTANSWAHVSLVPPLSSNVRKEPGLEAERVSRLAPGQIVWVMEGPRCADGYAWWLVRDSDYQQGWTAEGDTENYWLLPTQDSVFYNTDQPSASSHMVLAQGQNYRVTLSGTYSLWVRAQWTDAGVCIRGNFEVAPLFPSAGKENGPVGADAYARFARPFYGPCATTFEPGETISQIQLSTDGGATFALAVPISAQYRPDHTYVYEVKGHGYPLAIRLDDGVLQDNYGQILVLIEKAE